MLAVQRARLRLGNATLADIRDRLKANEAELISGTRALDKALKNLNRVRHVLETTTAFLKTIGRIVDIVV